MSTPVVHASAVHVFCLWSGASAFESQVYPQELSYVRACELVRPKFHEHDSKLMRCAGQSHTMVTCPACVMLCDEAAAQRETHLCTECGEAYEPQRRPLTRLLLQAPVVPLTLPTMCFACDFWLERIATFDHRSVVTADGSLHEIGQPQWEHPPTRNKDWLGYGGTRWCIEFIDGRREVTHNLWHRGTIPERFRSRLPVNAVFT